MRRWLIVFVLFSAAFVAAPPASAQTLDPADYFTPSEIERAEDYRDRAYMLSFAGTGIGLVVIALLGVGRGSRGLARSTRRFRRPTARALALVLVAGVAPELAALPFTLGSHRHARSFGLATSDAASAVRDLAIGVGFRTVILGMFALVVTGLARRLPRMWGPISGAAAAGLTALIVLVFPVVVEPAFNSFTPVDDQTRARVESIAARAGVEVGEVLVADASRRTNSLNAYVSGLGATKRVVIYDTLLDRAQPGEVDAVVAHELAHVAAGDVARGTIYASVGSAAGVLVLWGLLASGRIRRSIGAREPGDPAVIPFLAFYLTAAMLLTAPIASALSRDIERRADVTALTYTQRPGAMVALQVRLARENLADLTPPAFIRWAFFTHPTTMERIALAEAAR